MKLFIALLFLSVTTVGMAKEVNTECSAMNENREKVIKTDKPKVKNVKSSSHQ